MSRKGTVAIFTPSQPVPSFLKGLDFMRHKTSRRKRRSIEKQRQSQDQQQDDELWQTPVDVPHIAANDPSSQTDVLEVWFAGCHAGALFSLY